MVRDGCTGSARRPIGGMGHATIRAERRAIVRICLLPRQVLPSLPPMVPSESQAAPKRWIGIALAVLLLGSFALRMWDASHGLSSGRYFDERFTFKNISGLL